MNRGRAIVPNYCETTSPENPNQHIVDALLEQVKCMYERLVGSPTVPGVVQVKEDVSKFQDCIRCLEKANADLERELARLNSELARIWDDLQDEMDRRAELECLYCEAKQQINEIDQDLCCVTAERDQLLGENECLCHRNEEIQHALDDCQCERDALNRKLSHSEDSSRKQTCLEEDYKKALAECCCRVDELSKKIGCLTADLNRVNREKDDLQREKDELERKYNCLKEKYDNMKCVNDELIAKLKEEIKCLENQQEASCERFKQTLQSHHDEMDKINGEKLRAQEMLQDEKMKREEAERKLKDCEERKKQEGRGPGPGSGGGGFGGGGFGGPTPPRFHQPQPPCNNGDQNCSKCDQYKNDVQRLEQQKSDVENSRQCLERQVQHLSTQHDHAIQKVNHLEKEVEVLTTQNEHILKKAGHYEEKLQHYEKHHVEFDKMNNNNVVLQARLGEQAQIKTDLEKKVAKLQKELEAKEDSSQIRQNQDKIRFEAEKQQHIALMQEVEKEKQKLHSLAEMKSKIEGEVAQLKEAISKHIIDRNEFHKLKADYEGQVEDLQNKFESQLEMNRQLAEINEQLGKQFKDRDLINSIRDSNEELLRKELSSVINASKSDIEKLRRIINKRDEKVTSLRKAISLLKHKYISAAHENEELLKKVQNLAAVSSRENFLEMDSSDTENHNDSVG